MRIQRLHLAAFGPFTDLPLDFGDAAAEGGDLHVVYGSNEAGKSTTLRALIALLFGVDRTTSDNYLHDNPDIADVLYAHERSGGNVGELIRSELELILGVFSPHETDSRERDLVEAGGAGWSSAPRTPTWAVRSACRWTWSCWPRP